MAECLRDEGKTLLKTLSEKSPARAAGESACPKKWVSCQVRATWPAVSESCNWPLQGSVAVHVRAESVTFACAIHCSRLPVGGMCNDKYADESLGTDHTRSGANAEALISLDLCR